MIMKAMLVGLALGYGHTKRNIAMKFLDIAKKIGGSLLAASGPAGALIMGAINAALPEDKQLSATATGQDAMAAVSKLPAAAQERLLEKQFDVDITQIKEEHSTVRAMLSSDANNPQTTRPYIAKNAFHVIAFAIITVVTLWAVAIILNEPAMVKTVMDGWPFILAVIAPFVILLHAYFGIIKTEARDRLNSAGGHPNTGGLINAFISRIAGKK